MTQALEERVRRWLRAERRDDAAGAEGLLRAVFQALTVRGPSPGFADRVVRLVAASRGVFSHWSVRCAITTSLLLAGVAVGVLPYALWPLARMFDVQVVVDAAVTVTTAVVSWTRHGLLVWRVLADIGGALALAIKTPELLLPLTLITLMSALAFRLLASIASFDRSLVHVEPANR